MREDDSEELADLREKKRAELLHQATNDETVEPEPSASTPIHISGPDHFNEITNQYDVVLFDFHAEWCGPCKMIEPIVAHIATDTPAAVAKIDVDQLPALAQQVNVRGVPTLLLYADGEPVERLVGVQDEGTLRGLVDQYT